MDILKIVHISSAYLSIVGFIGRGILMIADSSYLTKKWLKVLPHVVDTILLVSAIMLAVRISQYPFVHDWLTAKLIALVLYIVLGTIALKRGKTKPVKIAAFVAALATVAYILMVAANRTPWPFQALQ